MPPVRDGGMSVARAECPTSEVARDKSKPDTRRSHSGTLLVACGDVTIARRTTRRVLHWIFRRGNQFLTLELDHVPGGVYTFSLVPHSSEERGVETCETGESAFQRHSVIASELRQSGWTLVAYTAGRNQRLVSTHRQHSAVGVSAFPLLFSQTRTDRAS